MSNILKEVDRTETTISVNTPITTNEIVSNFEKRLERSIANKVLNSAKDGKLPTFTPEETAYLNKQSSTPNTEVEVITADPPITLKAGGTRIDIKNAASLVKRMDRAHPRTTPDPELRAGGINSPDDGSQKWPYPTEGDKVLKELDEKRTAYLNNNQQPKSGRNAYEIREGVLEMALAHSAGKHYSPEQVLDVARQFYAFVENKR
jgi:hypothetical protein